MMRMRQISSYLLVAAGSTLLGYTCFIRADAWLFQRRGAQDLQRRREFGSRMRPVRPGLVGRLDIPLAGVSAVVAEGSDEPTLRRAVGHIAGTALPGDPGNVGLAGHRDTFFRALRDVHPQDLIVLTTARGEFRYRVVSTKVVAPNAVDVLNPSSEEILTLVTCYPFYFVGSAPKRFIVRAERAYAGGMRLLRP